VRIPDNRGEKGNKDREVVRPTLKKHTYGTGDNNWRRGCVMDKIDWHIAVKIILQYSVMVQDNQINNANFDFINAVTVKAKSPGDYLFIESEDSITSGDYKVDGQNWVYSDMEVSLAIDISEATLAEAKKALFQQIETLNLKFKKDKKVFVSFVEISQWNFYRYDDPDSDPIASFGGSSTENGIPFEIEREILGGDENNGKVWTMDESGKLTWV